jgi:hypothetical protein
VKQFIVMLAALPLMLGLLMQIGLSQGNFALTLRAESIARDFREEAADAGGFSHAMRAEAAVRLADAAGVQPGDISVEADSSPDADGALRYRIGVPVRKLTATPLLFGVNPKDNSGVYVIEGEVRVRAVEDDPAAGDDSAGTDDPAGADDAAGTGDPATEDDAAAGDDAATAGNPANSGT